MNGADLVDFRDRQFRRDVARLHRLGPRAIYELLSELGARRMCRTEVEATVARYAALDAAALDAAGGRDWP